MEDIRLVKQGWKWLRSQKDACLRARIALGRCKDKIGVFLERHWPTVCTGTVRLGSLLHFLLLQWSDCFIRGFRSLIALGSAALLLIMWSCFLSLTSISCLVLVLLSMVCFIFYFMVFLSILFSIGWQKSKCRWFYWFYHGLLR